jgi:pyrimidine deaminase RibD-like protein
LPALQRNWFADKGDKHAGFDLTMMRLALEAARAQRGRTGDNPAVGCVLAANDKGVGSNNKGYCEVFSIAATGDGGRPHAEEQAVAMRGAWEPKGKTAYVTLEPCAKRSTGAMSCADRLIEAGVARVVIATRDPHPNAAGVGIERLRAAGIAVELGLMEAEARALNADFIAKWGGA